MKKWETVKQSVERTGFCRATIMRFDKPGIFVRVGRAIRIDADALDSALEEMQATAGDHIKEE